MTLPFVGCAYNVLNILEVLEVTRVPGEFTASGSHWRKCEWVGHRPHDSSSTVDQVRANYWLG